MDILARAPVKGAAKRDSLCELQNSVKQWPPERALHSRDFPESMSASVLNLPQLCKQDVFLPCVLMSYCPLSQWLVNCLVLAKCFARCYSGFYLRGFT